jgi:hypothetical protein
MLHKAVATPSAKPQNARRVTKLGPTFFTSSAANCSTTSIMVFPLMPTCVFTFFDGPLAVFWSLSTLPVIAVARKLGVLATPKIDEYDLNTKVAIVTGCNTGMKLKNILLILYYCKSFVK